MSTSESWAAEKAKTSVRHFEDAHLIEVTEGNYPIHMDLIARIEAALLEARDVQAQSCQCEELKQMLKDAQANLEKTMHLLNEPIAQGFEEFWSEFSNDFEERHGFRPEIDGYHKAYLAGEQSQVVNPSVNEVVNQEQSVRPVRLPSEKEFVDSMRNKLTESGMSSAVSIYRWLIKEIERLNRIDTDEKESV